MHDDTFRSRERAFEAVYFARLDAKLIDQMHEEQEKTEARDALSKVTGISDESLLDAMIELGINPRTIEAMTVETLVCVAWANGSLVNKERDAALLAIESLGIQKGLPAHRLFESWLGQPAETELFNTWRNYIASVMSRLDSESCKSLREALLRRAREVAQATGGMRVTGWASRKERNVLNELEAAME